MKIDKIVFLLSSILILYFSVYLYKDEFRSYYKDAPVKMTCVEKQAQSTVTFEKEGFYYNIPIPQSQYDGMRKGQSYIVYISQYKLAKAANITEYHIDHLLIKGLIFFLCYLSCAKIIKYYNQFDVDEFTPLSIAFWQVYGNLVMIYLVWIPLYLWWVIIL